MSETATAPAPSVATTGGTVTITAPAPASAPSNPSREIPAPTTATGRAPSYSELSNDIDDLIGQSEKENAPEPKKETEIELEKPPEKLPEKPPEKPKTDEKKVEEPKKEVADDEVIPQTPKELRAAFLQQKKELKEARSRLNEKPKVQQPQEDTEKKTILEQLESTKARLAELDGKLKYANYEMTEEYAEKYVKPQERAYQTALEDVKTLKIESEDGTVRPGTDEDFNQLLYMNTGDAAAHSKKLFGDAAVEVMAHRRRIIDLNRDRKEATEKFKKESIEREKQSSVERAAAQERIQSGYKSAIQSQIEENPTFFGPAEGDEEGNELLDKGYQLADLAMTNNPNVPIEKKIQMAATVRNKAGSFDRLVVRYKSVMEENESLKAQLAAFSKTVPGEGESDMGVDIPSGKPTTWADDLDELNRLAADPNK